MTGLMASVETEFVRFMALKCDEDVNQIYCCFTSSFGNARYIALYMSFLIVLSRITLSCLPRWDRLETSS